MTWVKLMKLNIGHIFLGGLLELWYVWGMLALVIFIWQKGLRQRMLLAGFVVLPALLVKPIVSPNFWIIFEKNGGFLGFLLPRLVVAFSIGALLSAIYEVYLSRKISPAYHPSRPKMLLLISGLVLALILRFLFDQSFLLSVLAGMALNLLIIVFYERSLIWDLIFSACGMGLLYLVVFLQTSFGFPGDSNNLSFLENLSGINFFSFPVEEIAAVFMFGMLWGPIYVAIKDSYLQKLDVNFEIGYLKVKKIFSIGIFAIILIVTLAVVNNFLLMPAAGAPLSKDSSIMTNQELRITFNRPVYRPNLKFNINPPTVGTVYFDDSVLSRHMFKTVVFEPEGGLVPNTEYKISVDGLSNIFGFGNETFSYTFKTSPAEPYEGRVRDSKVVDIQPPVTIEGVENDANNVEAKVTLNSPPVSSTVLDVPQDFQDKALSCEAAALKMALRFKGSDVSEDQIMAIIGFDPTIRNGDIWGDPDMAFVGDINGKQNTSGYGVHWGPVARAANDWRGAQAFTNWTIQDLAREISNGNPVVIWGVIGNAYADDWLTPEGREIKAWKGEHTVTVVGFKGSADAPESFLINDPLKGGSYWSVGKLKSNWATFNNSGVVVY